MKIFTQVVLSFLLMAAVSESSAQAVFSNETFPNPFNLFYTTPINTGFNEAIGKWIGYTSDAKAVIAVDNKRSFSFPFALRLSNSPTPNFKDESTCRATGPIINIPCVTSLSLHFKLYNLNINPANEQYFLIALVSKDNGSNWTTVLMKTAAELVNEHGSNKWSDVNVTIPRNFRIHLYVFVL